MWQTHRIKKWLLLLLCGWWAVSAWAQNAVQSVSATQKDGQSVLRVQLREALTTLPKSFTTEDPSRLVFDFQDTINLLGRTGPTIDQGVIRGVNVVQSGQRTRLILNLRQRVKHQAEMEGNVLLITLAASTSADPVTPVAVAPAPSVTAEVTAKTHAIREIDVQRGTSGEGRVVIDLSEASTAIDIRPQGQNIVVDFQRTRLPDTLKKRFDMKSSRTPLQSVQAFQQGEHVRLLIETRGPWSYEAYQTDTQLVLEVHQKSADMSATQQPATYTGDKLSLNFQNIEVRAVLNVIADFTGLNVIASDTVTGNITLRLKDVPWDHALDIILQARGLDMRRNGNVIWVAPREELATREKLKLEAQEQIGDLNPVRTEAFQLNYQKAEEVQKILSNRLQPILSKRGSAVVDARTNLLFVKDVPARLEEVRRLLSLIDVAVRQVVIEARIVIAEDSFSRNLGARLGYNEAARSVPGTNGGSVQARLGGSLNTTGTGVNTLATAGSSAAQNVNLPADSVNGYAPGAFSFILFNRDLSRLLSAEISALEAEGRGKTVASPRVVTADMLEALIEQGTEIPYAQATSSGATSVAFRKANLSLRVKPQITPEGNVIMSVDVNKDEPGTNYPSGVSINTKHVKTEVLVENGGTVVIGGIFEESQTATENRVPVLGELPLIGMFFRNQRKATSRTELLVFITPRIVTDQAAAR